MVAAAHEVTGDLKTALDTYRLCTQRLPDFLWCHILIVPPLVKAGHLEEAREHVREVFRINPRQTLDQAVIPVKHPAKREWRRKALIAAGFSESS
jgi:hypothetical protein